MESATIVQPSDNGNISIEQKAQKTKISQPQHRPSVWGRMLITGTLLFGLAIEARAANNDSKTAQMKDETSVAQVSQSQTQMRNVAIVDSTKLKEEPHCSKASKRVKIDSVPHIFTAETCDNWDYVKIYFDDHKLLKKSHLDVNEDLAGVFKQREVNTGNDLCSSWIILGASKETYHIYLVTDIVAPDESGITRSFLADTGIKVSNSITWQTKQLTNCEWRLRLTDSSDNDSALLSLTNAGDVTELEQK